VKALPGGFAEHLREAIALNTARASFYAAYEGRSARRVTRALVRAERLLLPLAWAFDAWAARYEQAGVPVLSALFEPMTGLAAPVVGSPPGEGFRPLPVRPVRARIWGAYLAGGFEAAANVIADALASLQRGPFHAMRRHLLESARRVCTMAPTLRAQAQAEGLPDPGWMHAVLLYLHLAALGFAARIDAWAAPVQAAGGPMLSADLPSIPSRPKT